MSPMAICPRSATAVGSLSLGAQPWLLPNLGFQSDEHLGRCAPSLFAAESPGR